MASPEFSSSTNLGDILGGLTWNEANVWEKGHPIAGQNAHFVRRDDFGSEIHRGAYGDRSSPYGWEIDHITPVALGGSDAASNLRPLHHRTNASFGGILSALISQK